jgi:hypothetical protein
LNNCKLCEFYYFAVNVLGGSLPSMPVELFCHPARVNRNADAKGWVTLLRETQTSNYDQRQEKEKAQNVTCGEAPGQISPTGTRSSKVGSRQGGKREQGSEVIGNSLST